MSASGGTAPYTYSLYSGTLPAGLTLESNGALTGTPRAAGNFDLIVQVKDSHIVPFSTWRTYNLSITDPLKMYLPRILR